MRKARPRPRLRVLRRLVVNPAQDDVHRQRTGRGGEINRCKVPFKAEWGVDVADSQARKAALREGQIWAFFATKERAEKFTATRQTEGYDAIVVAATAKEVK